ncbi:hypothetical protein BY996DRAFT_6566448 [Phakopsora pachyrhizi]|nr:hypothetical protein BY996DRAFT_6566448 [Phakopsora pachyrhizi]
MSLLIYEAIEGRNIDKDIRNTQAGKFGGVVGWLKIPLFGYAIANHLRRPLYCFSLDSMHTYVPTNCSYSSYSPFFMAFVDTNHYLVLHFKTFNGSIPAPPIDDWWLRKSSSRNKNVWLQSLENDLKLFQKLMPSASRSIKPRTENKKFMRYIPQPLHRLIENIDNPPKDRDCGYTCVAWSSGQGRRISTLELIRKHLSAELKKDKKMYEMIEGRNIDKDIRNTQAVKSAGVAGWLKMTLFGSYHSGYPPFCIAFVNSNHYVVLHFKKFNGSIPTPPIDGWWLRKSTSSVASIFEKLFTVVSKTNAFSQ